MQLVQTDMQHSHEDIAAHNLQQYGDYMVIGHPTHAPAAHDSLYTDGQQEFVGSHTGAVRWYGSYSSGTDHAALVSPAAGPGEQVWNGQLPSQQAAWDKKRLPADVSRHNTPTSVFDIFNNLHISGTTASAQVADQLHQQLHMTGRHTIASQQYVLACLLLLLIFHLWFTSLLAAQCGPPHMFMLAVTKCTCSIFRRPACGLSDVHAYCFTF